MAKSTIRVKHNEFSDVPVASYATEANLDAALAKYGFLNDRHVRVRTDDGRWTAIFFQSNFAKTGGYIGIYADKGFMMVG